ncbi:MAG: 3-oxoacyl-[acyl-carrier-protein] reductase [Armatimonadetes bacterium]|nr:3-oxoacyl-[acyl-carrier-protein] reductase [Armatimonadota bacterium]
MTLSDQVAIVTGAGRAGKGIGRAIALALAKAGAGVAISDFVPENADRVANEIITAGGKAIAVSSDVTLNSDCEELVARTVNEFGRLDILINNAGITRDNLLLRMSETDWDSVISTNLKGAFLCTKAAARVMVKQRRGKIVNIASVMGIVGNAGQANYAASKGGIIALTKSVAKELGSRNINVNAVAPGFIQTMMTDALPEELRDRMREQVPLKRLGEPEDVANVVVFLCTEAASYLTGQVIMIDGGLFM